MALSKPNSLPKAPSVNINTLGLRASTYELWEEANIQSINKRGTQLDRTGFQKDSGAPVFLSWVTLGKSLNSFSLSILIGQIIPVLHILQGFNINSYDLSLRTMPRVCAWCWEQRFEEGRDGTLLQRATLDGVPISFSPSIQGDLCLVPSAASAQLIKSNVQYVRNGVNSCPHLSHFQKGNKWTL